MNTPLSITAAAFLTAMTFTVCAQDDVLPGSPGSEAPSFALRDTRGNEVHLSDFSGKFVVLEWTNPDCPFVLKHYKSGNMQSLQKKYTDLGVIWFSICSSAPGKQGNYPPKEIVKRMKKEKSSPTAYLFDEDGTVGRLFGAKTTPNMFVINPEGIIIYSGAIDDKPSTKVEDVPGAINYVAAALDASMAGKEVESKATQSYGCSVKY